MRQIINPIVKHALDFYLPQIYSYSYNHVFYTNNNIDILSKCWDLRDTPFPPSTWLSLSLVSQPVTET